MVLELRNIRKSYGPTVALNDTGMTLEEGEVHALLGENGAGKSTLVKILSGSVRPDSGELLVAGKRSAFSSPRDALKAGISTAYQELMIVPYMTVAQNLFLGERIRSRAWLTTSNILERRAEEVLSRWELEEVHPDTLCADLALGVRQQLELVRALHREARVLLLDEPTAALGAEQVRWLFRQIESVRQTGVTTLFISHRIGEVREICQTVTVLRGGRDVAHAATSSLTDDQVVELMAGRQLEAALSTGTSNPVLGEPILEVDRLGARPGLQSASFTLHQGEILGVAALQGQGQLELFNAIYGAGSTTRGSIRVRGKTVHFRSPAEAINHEVGISLVPEDRKSEGVMTAMSGLVNLTLPYLSTFSRAGVLNKNAERAAARKVISRLGIRPGALTENVSALSGGNQQKVAIGKWLIGNSRILLWFDPTRGVDVTTKSEIFTLMRELVAEGKAILFYSTDIEEIIGVADSILVLYRGEVVATLTGADKNQVAVLRRMLGVSKPQDQNNTAEGSR